MFSRSICSERGVSIHSEILRFKGLAPYSLVDFSNANSLIALSSKDSSMPILLARTLSSLSSLLAIPSS